MPREGVGKWGGPMSEASEMEKDRARSEKLREEEFNRENTPGTIEHAYSSLRRTGHWLKDFRLRTDIPKADAEREGREELKRALESVDVLKATLEGVLK